MNILDYIKSNKSQIHLHQFGRDDLAKLLNILDFRTGVEVGSAAGHFTAYLCQQNPQMMITAVDAWKPYEGYTDYKKHRTLNGLFNSFKRRIEKYQNHKVLRMFSQDALSFFEDNSLDFVYIDANHDEPWISQDIQGWNKKVRSGGIVAGHDYVDLKPNRKPKNWQVKPAVDLYVKENNIRPLVILGKGLSNLEKAGDQAPSWFYFKP